MPLQLCPNKFAPPPNRRIGRVNHTLTRPKFKNLGKTCNSGIPACENNKTAIHKKQIIIPKSDPFCPNLIIEPFRPHETPFLLKLPHKFISTNSIPNLQ